MLEMKAGQAALRRVRGLPVEAAGLDDKSALAGQVQNIAHAQERILEMRRDHGKIFRIKGDEFQEIHEPTNLLLSCYR
ncbi:hypothetical protein MAE02_21150 [Microvirga aerophila]|uniref:Uncharacterized protein n=1 Tax=Microvirga aerophila TaxID=670291 RepID=A0A512BQZ2_9HYPH|nr:hypothetical protein MAE02_21150 [Microvirga aerophila]